MGYQESKIRIVVADDHCVFRSGLRKLLSSDPEFEVVAEASNGHQTLQKLLEYEPDVLLLDLNMPEGNGTSLLEVVRDNYPKVKVIILIGWEEREVVGRAWRGMASGLVYKQAETELLRRSIRKVHQGISSFDRTAYETEYRYVQALTPLERSIAKFVAKGLTNDEIAGHLSVSQHTVKNNLRRIFRKLNVSDRLQLTVYWACHTEFPDPAAETSPQALLR